MVDAERAPWLLFAVTAVLNVVAILIWSIGFDQQDISPADIAWGGGVLCRSPPSRSTSRAGWPTARGPSSVDGLGITLYLAAIFTALTCRPARAQRREPPSRRLNVMYPCRKSGDVVRLLRAGSMTRRRLQRQDVLLILAFVVASGTDSAYVLGLAGTVPGADNVTALGQEVSFALIAAAAWARPSSAGVLPVGGWWELTSPACIAWRWPAGILVADHFYRLRPVGRRPRPPRPSPARCARLYRLRDVRSLALHRRQALTDELTGLPNRRALFARARRADAARRAPASRARCCSRPRRLQGAQRHARPRTPATTLLRAVGAAAAAGAAPGDLLARLGGDEFAVVLARAADDAGHGRRRGIARTRSSEPVDDRRHRRRASRPASASPTSRRTRDDRARARCAAPTSRCTTPSATRNGVAGYAPERDDHTPRRASRWPPSCAARSTRGELVAGTSSRRSTSPPAGSSAWRRSMRWKHPERGARAARRVPADRRADRARCAPLTDWVLDARARRGRARWREGGLDAARSRSTRPPPTLLDVGLPERRRRGCWSATRCPPTRLVPRGHRGRRDGRPASARCEVLARLLRARRRHLARRLRHRPLVARAAQAPAGRRAEDRPLVRQPHLPTTPATPRSSLDRRARPHTSACASSPRASRTPAEAWEGWPSGLRRRAGLRHRPARWPARDLHRVPARRAGRALADGFAGARGL